MSSEPVLIAGAGPTGLALAAALALAGIPSIVFEAEKELTRDLRAGSFHPPSIEMLDQIGVAADFIKIGIQVPRWQIRDRREGLIVEWDLGVIADETPYPFRLHCEQFKLTPLLKRRYESLGGLIRFEHRFLDATQDGAGVIARVQTPAGVETVRGCYLIGADGARSAVRRAMLNVEYEGFTWPERFLVMGTTRDLAPYGYAMNAYSADPVEWAAIFKMPYDAATSGLWRVLIPVDAGLSDDELLSPGFAEAKLQGLQPVSGSYDIAHVGIYNVHQRVASQFRQGRIVLIGDAAHSNNPLGAFGLNGGLHDAFNLAEKLVALHRKQSDDAILDKYTRQRRVACVDFVQAQSIGNKRMLEEKDDALRAKKYGELRAICADRAKAKEFLLRSSMVASVRQAAAVD